MGKLSKTHQTTWGIFSLFPLFIYIHILSSGSNEYVVPVGTFIGELDGGGISYLRRFLFALLPLLCPPHAPPPPPPPWQPPPPNSPCQILPGNQTSWQCAVRPILGWEENLISNQSQSAKFIKKCPLNSIFAAFCKFKFGTVLDYMTKLPKPQLHCKFTPGGGS